MLILLLVPLLGMAQNFASVPSIDNYNDGAYNGAWEAKVIGNRVYVTASIGDHDANSGNDVMHFVRISVNSTQIFEITNEQYSRGGTHLHDMGGGEDDHNEWYYSTSNGFSVSTSTAYENDNNVVAYFSFALPIEFLSTGSITVTCDAKTDEESSSRTFTRSLTTPIAPSLSALRAAQGCNSVKLSWDKVKIDAALNRNEFRFAIYNNGNLVATPSINTTDYTITGVTTAITAELQLQWNNSEIDSKSAEGSPYDPLAIPSDLQASTSKCDGSIDLKWQWMQASPTNFIIYKSTNPSSDFSAISDVILGSKRSYKLTGLTRGQKYYFKIAAKGGKCPGEGEKSEEAIMGISPADPMTPTNAKMLLVSGSESGVSLSWNEPQWVLEDYQNATNQKYKILRKDLKKGTETTIELPIQDLYESQIKNQTREANGYLISYIDKEVSTCESYSYKIVAANECKSSPAATCLKADSSDKISITNIDLSRVFLANNLETSKGYHGNLVQLDWKTDENADFVGNYKIYRRALNSTIAPELQMIVDKNTRSWSDNKAVSQTLYEYYVVASADCGLDKLSSYDINAVSGVQYTQLIGLKGLASGIGFRLPSAIVTGNINYTGGVAVPNVKVVAEKDGIVTGNALSFNGVNQSVKINPNQETIAYNTTGMSVSLWAKPKAWTSKQVLASQAGVFQVELKNDRVVVTIAGTSITSKAKLIDGNYSNIFATYDTSKLELYINGKLDKSTTANGSLAANVTNSIYLGSSGSGDFYNGLLDEFRVYKAALTAEDVGRDYSRLVQGETPNIVGNWRFDEGVGPFVFDSSKEGGVYNKIDGDLMGATWSKEVPSKEQLGFAGFTDKNGNYVIEGISYNGTGENFSITPTMTLSGAIHSFSPSNRILFLGEGRSVENNIDFIDQSSFKVTGAIRFDFDNTENDPTHFQSSGSKGVSIWLNGTQQLTKNGLPIVSNELGQFEVVVPIGKHFLEFRKDGHTFISKNKEGDIFDSNKFPATGTYDYQDILSGIEVFDTTKHTFTGCVVGGLVQANKKLGFSAYKGKLKTGAQRVNNIGATYFTLTSKDTHIKRLVKTDPETGEFVIQLPPNEYEFSDVYYVGDEANLADDKILFVSKDLSAIKLDDEAAYKGIEARKSFWFSEVDVAKTVKYNAAKRLIYRSTPTMVVQNNTAKDYLPNTAELDGSGNVIEKTVVGETTVKIYDKELSKDILLPTKALPYPVFSQGKGYQVAIKAIEKYAYYGTKPTNNPATDQVPVLDGQVTISNNISAKADAGSAAAYQLVNEDWVSLSGNTHQFNLQNEGSVNYNFIGGDPDLIQGSGADDSFVKTMSIALKTGDYTVYWPDPNNASKGYKGYVLGGSKMPGTDFITEAPFL